MGTRDDLRNLSGRRAVAERIVRARHGGIAVLIVQKAEDFGNNMIFVGPDKAGGASRNARTEERRAGKERVRTCRSRRSPSHYTKKIYKRTIIKSARITYYHLNQ